MSILVISQCRVKLETKRQNHTEQIEVLPETINPNPDQSSPLMLEPNQPQQVLQVRANQRQRGAGRCRSERANEQKRRRCSEEFKCAGLMHRQRQPEDAEL